MRRKRAAEKRDIEDQIARDYPDGLPAADSNNMSQTISASASPQGNPLDVPSLETMMSEIAAMSKGQTGCESMVSSPASATVSSPSPSSVSSSVSREGKACTPSAFSGLSTEQLLELAHLSEIEEKRQLAAAASAERHLIVRRKRVNIADMKRRLQKVVNLDFAKKEKRQPCRAHLGPINFM